MVNHQEFQLHLFFFLFSPIWICVDSKWPVFVRLLPERCHRKKKKAQIPYIFIEHCKSLLRTCEIAHCG
ncbi:hypothetical protein BY458DRAFT_518240 [Sporodiniella umbellata]|nr:hypothetical protein BY458DRAFT_518240 [Sporodiniella umbellata]